MFAFRTTISAIAMLLAIAAWADADSGSGSEYGELDDEFEAASDAIESGNYLVAIEELDKLIASYPDDADILNLLGYSHRKLRDYERAEHYYLQALEIEPGHRGANEYLGQLYLETDRPELARERLEVLDDACFLPCKQYRELKKAISDYEDS